MEEALSRPHPPVLVKTNREEYGPEDGGGRTWVRARELHLSDGPAMLHVLTPEGRFRVVPPRVVEVNPIGCGDCYVAGLAHARLSGMSLSEQVAYAAAAGAANAARSDVARITPDEISRLVGQVQVTPSGT